MEPLGAGGGAASAIVAATGWVVVVAGTGNRDDVGSADGSLREPLGGTWGPSAETLEVGTVTTTARDVLSWL